MNQPAHKIGWNIWFGIFIFGGLLALALVMAQLGKALSTVDLTPIGPIAGFTLTNQNNQPVTLADLRGHVWIADIIFTRCPGPCTRMTTQMKELQDALSAAGETKLVSLTTDAEYDTPVILQRYADRFGANSNRWIFLTGDPRDIATLAIDSLKLTTVAKKPEERTSPNDLFVHSTIFVIVGKHGRLRGVFETEGQDVDWPGMKKKILRAARELERES